MNQEKIEELLDRYLNRITSSEENELVEKWLQEYSNPHSNWDEMDRNSKDQWLSKRLEEINTTINIGSKRTHKLPSKRRLAWVASIAAAASIVLAVILYSELPMIKNIWKTDELIVQVTAIGQKKLIILADGTRVWVNHNSTFKYPQTFDGNTREVFLSGEAYFDVKHDAKKTFIIHNGNISTTVLGTAFNIREDKGKHTIEVTVNRGKVSVANSGKTLAYLTPNQQLSFNTQKQQPQQNTVDANKVSAWKKEDLHFEDIKFSEAIAQLSMHFGVNISLSNEKLKNCRFTGTNLAHQELEDILNVMCAFNGATYIKNNDGSIVISGKGCN